MRVIKIALKSLINLDFLLTLMNLKDITDWMKRIDDWSLDAGKSIRKDYEFQNFKRAINFVDQVAEIAEESEHHPSILINYNKVRLTLSTHDAGELTEKDFKVAEKIDKLHR